MTECWFDLSRGIRTVTPQELLQTELSSGSLTDAVQYQGASPRLVRSLLSTLPHESFNAHFVDYGCGKGRALFLAAEAGFKKITGVEFSSRLAAQAHSNLRRIPRRSSRPCPQIWIGDAALYRPPQGPLVAFLYNPFHGTTLEKVAEHLADHASAEPAATWILYMNPSGLSTFLKAGFMETSRIERRGRLQAVQLMLHPGKSLET